MREYPAHEDLGLDPEADQTEDLRPGNSRTALDYPVLPAPARTVLTRFHNHEESE